MRRSTGLLLFLIALASMSAALSVGASGGQKSNFYHQGVEGTLYRSVLGGLPDTTNSLFWGSGKCAGCHGEDPDDLASIAGQTFPMQPMPDGWDVNVVDDWRSSIMGNSTKDPFWRAKVRHEVITNPSHAVGLEDKCTSCHAPVGHFAAHHDGAEYYSLLEALTDSLALDGVSCGVCHQQDAQGIGTRFSGEMTFVEDTIYGQYGGGKDEYPVQMQPMLSFGVKALYGEHISRSESCAACHSLITSSVTLEGEYTGETVIEQATYHEWVNSVYESGPEKQECQGCHMPQIEDPVTIASQQTWLQPRSPYSLHYFVGSNTHMLRMLRNNIDSLGLSASEAQFDSTIDRTLDMLQEQTLDLDAEVILDDGLPRVEVGLLNKAGHKFPSGYPARRAWIELQVTGDEGNTLYHNGAWNPETGHILGQEDVAWEPHHDVVASEDEVVIYELVLGDVNGDPTTVLERAHEHLKDNRLTPRGFSSQHVVYDTTAIVGAAFSDPNFNLNSEGEEGTGGDAVTYLLPSGWEEEPTLTIECTVWYQSMPPKWMAPMLQIQGDSLINGFRELYAEFVPTPERIATVTFTESIIGVTEAPPFTLSAYPNPSRGEGVTIAQSDDKPLGRYQLINATGKLIEQGDCPQARLRLQLPASGRYTLRTESGSSVALIRE